MPPLALPRRIEPRPAHGITPASPAVGRWLAALVVTLLLAAFGLAARGGR